jgi:hypothetical protein
VADRVATKVAHATLSSMEEDYTRRIEEFQANNKERSKT